MDAVTYPDTRVIDFINRNFIPLRLSIDDEIHTEEFNVHWTPTVIVLDKYRKEHHRTMGFLSPEEFIPSLYLGIGKACFDSDQIQKALEYFDSLLTEYPGSDFAPQGLYLQGVSRYKTTHDPKPLRDAYDTLNEKHPESYWAKRAYPYSLLNA